MSSFMKTQTATVIRPAATTATGHPDLSAKNFGGQFGAAA